MRIGSQAAAPTFVAMLFLVDAWLAFGALALSRLAGSRALMLLALAPSLACVLLGFRLAQVMLGAEGAVAARLPGLLVWGLAILLMATGVSVLAVLTILG